MKNLTLCFLMHVFGKAPILCRCPFSEDSSETQQAATINITHIHQYGKANIAGNGTIQYKRSQEDYNQLTQLKEHNRTLSELIQMLRNRDK